jgi:hypothetical protein
MACFLYVSNAGRLLTRWEIISPGSIEARSWLSKVATLLVRRVLAMVLNWLSEYIV